MAIYTIENTYGDVTVTVDGVKVMAIYADTDAGFVDRYVDPQPPGANDWVIERVYGDVQVTLGEGAIHVD